MKMKNRIEFTLPLTISTLVQCHAPFVDQQMCQVFADALRE